MGIELNIKERFYKEFKEDYRHPEMIQFIHKLLGELADGIEGFKMDEKRHIPLMDEDWFKGKNKMEVFNSALEIVVYNLKSNME